MYNDDIIKQYEPKIERILLYNESVPISSSVGDDAMLTYAFENYLIKYHTNPKNQQLGKAIQKKLNNLMDVMLEKPKLMNNSYIFSRDDIIRELYPSRYPEFEKYYNQIEWESVLNRVLNDEQVSENSINKLSTILSRELTFNPTTDRQKYVLSQAEKYYKHLLAKNVVPKNETEKLFIFNYSSKYLLKNEGYKRDLPLKVRLCDIVDDPGKFTGGYHINSFIAMNAKQCQDTHFYHSLDQMVQTIMHETEHYVQELKSKEDRFTKEGMQMAIHRLFGQKEYKTGDNYLFSEIEEDANWKGYWYAGLVYIGVNKEAYDKISKEGHEFFNNRRYQYEYVTVTLSNGKKVHRSKEKYNVEGIMDVIRKHPSLVDKYPVLNTIFTKNGEVKPFSTMLAEDFQSHDIDRMYEDFLLYNINHGGLDTLKLDGKSDIEKYNTLRKLENLLYGEIKYVLDTLDDFDYRECNQKNVSFLCDKHLEKIIKISSFLETQLDFMRTYNESNPNKIDIYGGYTTEIRKLMNNISKTYNEKKIGSLNGVFMGKKNQLKELDKNIINDYILDIINKLPDSDKYMPIQDANGNTVECQYYLATFLQKHMDRDHYVHSDNGKIYTKHDGSYLSPSAFVREYVQLLKSSSNQMDNQDYKKMGFTVAWLTGLLVGVVSVGILLLGVFLSK